MEVIMKSAVLLSTVVRMWSVLAQTTNDEALRVIGGYKDTERQYPWVVFMFKNDTQGRCTGSLLSPVWTLSAAHCAPAAERVYLYENGQTFSLKLIEQMQYSRVVLIIPHEMYTAYSHDIALYKITAMSIPKYGKLSAMDYKSLAGREVTVMGFGREKFLTTYNEDPINFNWKSTFNLASGMITHCDQSDITNRLVASKPTMCIVRPCGEVGLVAQGDSGGPVVYNGAIVGINSHIYDVGISRTYIPRATVSVHSVYAVPISLYLDWISKILSDNKYI